MTPIGDSESGTVVADLGGHAGNRELSVPPGRYFVRARQPNQLYEGTLTVRAGSSHRIDLDDFTRIAYARLVRKGMAHSLAVHGLETGLRLRSPLPNERDGCLGGFVGYSVGARFFALVAATPSASVAKITAVVLPIARANPRATSAR